MRLASRGPSDSDTPRPRRRRSAAATDFPASAQGLAPHRRRGVDAEGRVVAAHASNEPADSPPALPPPPPPPFSSTALPHPSSAGQARLQPAPLRFLPADRRLGEGGGGGSSEGGWKEVRAGGRKATARCRVQRMGRLVKRVAPAQPLPCVCVCARALIISTGRREPDISPAPPRRRRRDTVGGQPAAAAGAPSAPVVASRPAGSCRCRWRASARRARLGGGAGGGLTAAGRPKQMR